MTADIRVIGLGNVLMGDDGFGPYVIHELTTKYEFPPEVAVMDIGTPGLDLTPYLMYASKLIVVDTVRSEGPAGSLRLYRRDAILKHAPQPRLGPHDPGLKETLLALEFDGSGPDEVLLVGVIPQQSTPGPGLSPVVRDAVGEAALEVLLELSRLGVTVRERPDAGSVSPWWEAAPAGDGIPAADS
jgi:hydrogenase maturation protease